MLQDLDLCKKRKKKKVFIPVLLKDSGLCHFPGKGRGARWSPHTGSISEGLRGTGNRERAVGMSPVLAGGRGARRQECSSPLFPSRPPPRPPKTSTVLPGLRPAAGWLEGGTVGFFGGVGSGTPGPPCGRWESK